MQYMIFQYRLKLVLIQWISNDFKAIVENIFLPKQKVVYKFKPKSQPNVVASHLHSTLPIKIYPYPKKEKAWTSMSQVNSFCFRVVNLDVWKKCLRKICLISSPSLIIISLVFTQGYHLYISGIWRDKTMTDKLVYVPNSLFCRL